MNAEPGTHKQCRHIVSVVSYIYTKHEISIPMMIKKAMDHLVSKPSTFKCEIGRAHV